MEMLFHSCVVVVLVILYWTNLKNERFKVIGDSTIHPSIFWFRLTASC